MARETLKLRIKTMEPLLSAKEAEIARFVMTEPKKASEMTISSMSDHLGMADSTIFKFTRKLGYQGFRNFHNDLLSEGFDPEVSIHENITAENSPLEMADEVFNSSIKSLSDTKMLLKEDDIAAAVSHIVSCRRLLFHGMGGSSLIAGDAYHKFMRAPVDVVYTADYHMQLMQASAATDADSAIVISHSGLDLQTIQIAKLLKKRGAYIITITSNPASPLAKSSDIVLVTVSEETGYRSESLSSRIAQLAIIDTLYTAVMFHDEERSRESLMLVREAIALTRAKQR